MTYLEKLRDPRWQRKRLGVFERDGFKCLLCGDTKSTLHVHHGYYETGFDPWDYYDNTLHTLCESCHEIIQEAMRDVHRAIAMLSPEKLVRLQRRASRLVKTDPIDDRKISIASLQDQFVYTKDMAEQDLGARRNFRQIKGEHKDALEKLYSHTLTDDEELVLLSDIFQKERKRMGLTS